ncbi:protein phosphatase-2A subunit-alpha [Capsaspora owczarzaki ATCC 30864]|uniref:Serine/threonine-protein phosphatase 2A 55 kDa regulatory subunit B n=1 Tax=Capsaspora owczarzaki (strain ATCC 30864) TaxID=595528 RepID=A0A0D2WRV5_CAPO3|nr:protein phosphatase-2A subunit-alpha [Capsaspora owczarzaki ATCC 30864]KJE94048.1 protein phosphatase-2A subunit-alpha [Capsaspora owczarzaki ATCC 30864]|eukprot:XP_004347496.2 protein phosphatase-2A subunit-alpha [Capsaspora owczarzaki ATCC 30864]
MAMADEREWRFLQAFGDKGNVEELAEVDIISTVEFSHDGEFLATGDKGGRIVLFEKHEDRARGVPEFKFYTEFQSHEPEFDYLKSLEIEEKINKIKWLPRQNAAHMLLSTNDKTIKLWKVYEKDIQSVFDTNFDSTPQEKRDPTSITSLRVPKIQRVETAVAAVPRRVYANAHAYHINSVSINSDHETFLSADDLRINLWNLSISDQSFNMVDIKPANMEELTEVITAAEFHPRHCSQFMYSSSKGTIKLCDQRVSALCDQHAKLFEEEEDPANKSFFSEIISSISDVRFSNEGRYIVSRDYLTIKIWDVNMESRPVQTFHIHEYLRSKLCDLYENDCIFDKFECSWSGDDQNIITGSYHNMFHIFDAAGTTDICLEATKTEKKPIKINTSKKQAGGKKKAKDEINPESIDFNRKILHTAWHPRQNLVAVAATNNLFLYAQY